MKPMELKRMGLAPITDLEINEINGGGWLSNFLKRVTWVGVAYDVINHWEEIKRGFSNGWNFDQPKQPKSLS
ncbi:MAG: hypothetical protein V4539_12270 [Bacteroidota bacterium]